MRTCYTCKRKDITILYSTKLCNASAVDVVFKKMSMWLSVIL